MLFGARAPEEAGRASRKNELWVQCTCYVGCLVIGLDLKFATLCRSAHRLLQRYLRYQRFPAACKADSCFQAKQKPDADQQKAKGTSLRRPHVPFDLLVATILQVLDQHASVCWLRVRS